MPKNYKIKSIVLVVSLFSLTLLVYVLYLFFDIPLTVKRDDKVSSHLPETGEEQLENSVYRYRVFVTSGIYDAGFGSIDSADDLCQTIASSAGHESIWATWISDSNQNAKERIRDVEYYLLNGAGPIALNKSDMTDGDLLRQINLDENSNTLLSGDVWTGTTANGDKAPNNCNNWSKVETFQGTVGDLNSSSSGWTDSQLKDCSEASHLYCFEVLKDRDRDGYYEIVDGFVHPDELDCNDNDSSVNPEAVRSVMGLIIIVSGNIDENLTESCGEDAGICRKGTKTCSNGEWGGCVGSITPETEVCDGKDNDCDGEIDENLEKTCGSNIGVCTKGVRICSNGSWSKCNGKTPKAEICDGLDNDCDNEIDEGCECEKGETQRCGSDLGVCSSGTQWCKGSTWGECEGEVGPRVEICDGLDNDCDGVVDNGVERSCGSDIGICKKGSQKCEGGVWGECIGGQGPREEKCDGLDNDCDGSKDETCACKYGEVQTCGIDIGLCKKGKQYCENGSWGDCRDSIAPSEEICDEYDNDCDGDIDEDYVCEDEEVAEVKKSETKTTSSNNKEKGGRFFESLGGVTTLIIGVMISLGTFAGMFFVYKLTTNRHKNTISIFKKSTKSTSFKSKVRKSDSRSKSPLG